MQPHNLSILFHVNERIGVFRTALLNSSKVGVMYVEGKLREIRSVASEVESRGVRLKIQDLSICSFEWRSVTIR